MSAYLTSASSLYARDWANVDNLVESTKIERQVVPPPPCKKVHRKEKKDKKSKKEKKIKKKDEKSIGKVYFPVKKQVIDESEQLEKSCLTEEEHEQRHNVGYLSDGSQNSKKRRRETSPSVESNIKATPVVGNPLRIRFVFKKPKEADPVPENDRVCSTSGAERPVEFPSSVPELKTASDHVDNLLSTSVESDKVAIPCGDSKRRKKHKTSKESRYNSLFDEWVPLSISLPVDHSNGDDDWLFSSRPASNKAAIKNGCLDSMVTEDSSFPKAQFLPEAGIFSLPYTVLF